MNDSKPIKCQKCGKPLGYVTMLTKGFYITATTSSKREAGSHLHGVFFEEKLEKKE
jgi:hypothetical protein